MENETVAQQPMPATEGVGSKDLLAASRALCKKLHEVHDDPQYKAVWSLAYAHIGNYTGANYVQALADLEAAIEDAANERDMP